MTTYSWAQWGKTAAENSGGPVLPVGTGYQGEIVEAGAKATRSATTPTQFFFKVKVLVGPQAGKVERLTQGLTPGNERALAALFGTLGRLGIDMSQVPDNTPPEAIAKMALGKRIQFDLEHRAGDKGTFADFKNIKQLDTVTVPAQPVAAPAPAPAPAPVAETATPDVAALQAQLAALQAQQAEAPAVPTAPAAGASGLPF